ncbi:hypothetical protein [Thermomonas flagellata]|uniref:hypothetical protein n=1 Tax=Thermomonas flagellata TaxID=2888524 RepID=UPI001F046814|nr:hypothetical protein [Thermomonas flagellata]
MPQDWSQRAVVYADPLLPGATADARLGGAGWDVRYRDPRYLLSMAKRLQAEAGAVPAAMAYAAPSALQASATRDVRHRRSPNTPPPATSSLQRDWSNVLGGGPNGQGGRGSLNLFPAKYSYDIFAAPNCTNDFVVYPTVAPGANSSGSREQWVGTFTGNPGNGNTVTIGSAMPRQVVLTASASDNTGTNFQNPNNNNTRAANLAAAINRYSSQTGFTAVASGAQVTIYSETTGNVTNSLVSETLNNFSLTRTNGTGTAGQPTIVAFNQLYQGQCNGPWNQNGAIKAPNVLWAYNTGNGYTVETSPVLSYHDDARQVAFVQRNGNTLQLVLLKWAAGQGTAASPATPATVATSGAAYAAARAGSGSAMLALTFSGTSNTDGQATFSSPYVDYAADVLWVGDGNGRLHKFTGVFQGVPTEVTTGGFPATVEAGMKLSSPVAFAGQVYVGSQSGGAGIGGKLHRVDASTGSVVSGAKLAFDNTTGLRDSVLVDANTGSVFGFLFSTPIASDQPTCTISPSTNGLTNACRAVVRYPLTFAAGAPPAEIAYVGRGNSTVSTLYAGMFDEAYYSSPTGTGALYIVGGASNDTFVPTLWKIPLVNGAMGTPVIGPVVGLNDCNTVGDCLTNNWDWSPVTVIKNGSREFLYFSMAKKANLPATGCTGDCLYMFDVASGPWSPSLAPGAGLPTFGGTSGIVVDNISSSPGASQVYFSHGGNVNGTGNAVQASQAGLL